MTNQQAPRKTQTSGAFYAQAAISFGVATFSVCLGVLLLPVDWWIRAFLAVGVLYTVTSAFTLAKVIRDRQEESSIVGRVDQARVERLLSEHNPYSSVA